MNIYQFINELEKLDQTIEEYKYNKQTQLEVHLKQRVLYIFNQRYSMEMIIKYFKIIWRCHLKIPKAELRCNSWILVEIRIVYEEEGFKLKYRDFFCRTPNQYKFHLQFRVQKDKQKKEKLQQCILSKEFRTDNNSQIKTIKKQVPYSEENIKQHQIMREQNNQHLMNQYANSFINRNLCNNEIILQYRINSLMRVFSGKKNYPYVLQGRKIALLKRLQKTETTLESQLNGKIKNIYELSSQTLELYLIISKILEVLLLHYNIVNVIVPTN